MAVALKYAQFSTARELAAFAASTATVVTIVSIVFDGASGKHILYYLS